MIKNKVVEKSMKIMTAAGSIFLLKTSEKS